MFNERTITERLRKLAVVPRGSRVLLGIGDDCAIVRAGAEDLLFTTDLFVEGTHFLRETCRASDVAKKALARSLSDVAAMGGQPRFCLVSLCAAPWTDRRWLDRFFDTLTASAATFGTVLAGGDLSHGAVFVCDVMLCGAVSRGKALRRDGAKQGHEIYVTGELGGSALGLLRGKGKAWRRHLNPEPRLDVGAFIGSRLKATAAIDISDGLSLDLQRLCLASGVSAEITHPPAFPGASPDQALHGGEEYELLFTVRPGTAVPSSFKGIPITRLGSIKGGNPGEILLEGRKIEPMGYDHFQNQ